MSSAALCNCIIRAELCAGWGEAEIRNHIMGSEDMLRRGNGDILIKSALC